MKLQDFGYNDNIEKLKIEHNLEGFEIGRIISEHKERYTVTTEKGEFDAEITGNLRYTANTREDFPAVGDWVALVVYDSYSSIIHKVLPRNSIISRKAVGQFGDLQIIATNIDYAFIMLAVDRDFSTNRIERYLTICNTSNIQPFIILTKIDLINEVLLNELIATLKKRVNKVPIIAISNTSKQGYEKLKEVIVREKTYCLLGSSGVGKSTLVNTLANKELMDTKNVSSFSKRGQHSTTHRELILLDNGGILIDNPGIREVGITDTSHGLEKTFEIIFEYSKHCKFKDCSHTIEIGCAVIEAVEVEEIDKSSYKNYLKMEKEKEHFEATAAEKRKKEKDFGKMVKHFKKIKRSSKY
ncbi:ribosome biogenesis GTPase [Tenacibaculum gallaicum]|uniref:Small ribosomal subunit biogenesis GTPase RsgA n=1 Tax=Tenacibaculum gallaicum TaxID=561505 RepID=A0A3E0HF09_9FLAO|nr:ribosome small subunit-dependent GTPase A [Tenacibaculum gallaicum]REH43395.1 ribosome biogenesis GTPase [Tenacibaculum gallaicum]